MASYLRPRTLDEAMAMLAEDAGKHPATSMDTLKVVAGATDFYPAATNRQAWFQPNPKNVLDIAGITELRGLRQEADGLWIGALATWTDVLDAALPPAFDGLKQAARQVGGMQIQNRGTLVGNLCNASPAADGMPPLLALDAAAEITSVAGRRVVPLSAFVLGNRRTALAAGEIVSGIRIPTPDKREHSGFLKLGARSSLVISIASVAANLLLDDKGCIAQARIAVGACSAVPQRFPALEAHLKGRRADEASHAVTAGMMTELNPIDDVRASAAYRRDAAKTLVCRALDMLAAPSSSISMEAVA